MDDQKREILSDLLLDWEDQFRQGQDIPAAELAREYPELVAELAERIVAMKATAWLENPLTGSSPLSEPPHEESARRTLAGRYRLDELIALGGFAEVWRAYDKELQRAVAIKIPKAGRGQSSDDFMAEARRVARLRHSGIVPVHDVGREADQAFIVSEFMDGGSLASRLAKKAINTDTVVRWVAEIADALEYAHLNGVIHRDIKPANILLNHHDEALLGDFGIAQSANKTGRFDPSLGTLFYMSPEQLEGRPVTPASDIYGLAVVLYEALTGEMPYSSSEPNIVRREITTGRKKAWPTKLPKQLVPLVAKALSRNPQQRHTSAAHFATDLRRAWNGSSGRIRWLPWVASTLLVAFGLAGFFVWSRQQLDAEPINIPQPPVNNNIRNDLEGIRTSVNNLTKSIIAQHQQEDTSAPAITWPIFPPELLERSSTNSVGMKFVLIPAGSFVVGSPTSEVGRDPDEKQVLVTLTEPFWLGTTEVTLTQWQTVMKGFAWPAEEQSGDCAFSHATWEHANLFCEWLTKLEREAGHIGQETFYRLPTEAEWEYAARCGRPGAYCFGEDPNDLSQYGWWGCESENGSSQHECYSHPVAKKKPNRWGLYDMHGNLWEWCSDRYGPTRLGGTDPTGPKFGKARVLKGGSYQDEPGTLRSANRHPEQHDHHWPYIGFRVVRVGE